jgi:hypothetical protein
MRWEYLSIWTTTPARAGAVAKAVIAAPANSSPASRRTDSRFMIAPLPLDFVAGMMRFRRADCKDRAGARARAVAVKLNPQAFVTAAIK